MCENSTIPSQRRNAEDFWECTGKMEVVIWFLITNIVIRIPLEDLHIVILVLLSNCENNYLERGYLLRQGFCLLSEDRIMSLSVPVDKDLGEMCGISFEAERSFFRSYLIFLSFSHVV